jgi:hypothetical protein
LGIGTTVVDCGIDCADATYTFDRASSAVSPAVYYDCQGKADPKLCTATKISTTYQVINPVWLLGSNYSQGVVLVMPAIPDSQPGAGAAHGELIFGIDSQANNTLPPGVQKVFLSTLQSSESYLSIKTQFKGHTYVNSYLDTGTNATFFSDASITPCDVKPFDFQTYWYCPSSALKNLEAQISDGDPTLNKAVSVSFQVANFAVLSSTSNTAFSNSAGGINNTNPLYDAKNPSNQSKYIPDTKTFAWGMPFFYGKRVYMSIIDLDGADKSKLPWYAWTAL